MRFLIHLGLLLPLFVPITAPAGDSIDRAEELVAEKDWQGARELLSDHVAKVAGDARSHELLGVVLTNLDQRDMAAHHLSMALEIYEAKGDKRGASNAARSLQRADPLHNRRASLQRDATSKLYKAAEKLFDMGHPARAMDILSRMQPILSGKDAPKALRLLEKVRAASEEVDLDKAGADNEEGGVWPLITFESEHYVLEANLEQELVELVAETMDDIFGYYVLLYYDGDERAAATAKATIRVHPSKEAMLGNWTGGSAPEGWWSPGENQVTCYDTRTSTGTLDWMLETLFHEASHQFMSLLERKGGSSPAWLNEGTASFFEGATAMADHRVLWPDAAVKRLANLVSMLNGAMAGPSLADVIGYNSPGSYPGNYYAWGWGIVFFMQQYEDPETLEYVFRPLYSDYRERITSRGGNSRELFEEIFLGERSPLGHETLADFNRDWSKWILESVSPLHVAAKKERRELRLALANRYSQAAILAADNKKAPVEELELLSRALGHIEYIRDKIDGEDHHDVTLLAQQATIFERLERPAAAAPLVELLLQLADDDEWAPSEEEYAELEKRLQRLDKKNYALRRAESTRKSLQRSARRLFEDYRDDDDPLQLRAYTMASQLGAALDDTEVLLPAAQELRQTMKEQGLLFGRVHSLVASTRNWMTIYSTKPDRFRAEDNVIELSAVRPNAQLNTTIELSDEYQLRATFKRDGELHRSTCHGIVLAGVREGDWLVFGLLKSGKAGLWRLQLSSGGGVTTKKIQTFYLDPPPADDQDLSVSIHVSDNEAIEIRVGECEPIGAYIPDDMPRGRFAGVYAKDGKTVLIDPVLELY